MSTTRLLQASSKAGPLHHLSAPSTSYSFSVRFSGNGDTKDRIPIGNFDCSQRRLDSTVAARAIGASSSADQTSQTSTSSAQITAAPWTEIDLASLVNKLKMVGLSNPPPAATADVNRKQGKFHIQMAIERAIFDCRFFTLLAVAGSLLGSVLCFMEVCFLVAESYSHYFHTLSTNLDQGHMMKLLIEAIDMFLVGTAMLVFGVGLHAMFVGSKDSQHDKQTWLPHSNLFGIFHLKYLPAWVETRSVSQAKSKIGHAVMMILQVGLLEKFKNVPLVTSFDLACFAAAVLVSSASTFLLSKLYTGADDR
ncbi:unnamed protein product [Linum tenue]|uniref:Uncharacterized protein n=1 Tax=Linum tenue TaxID=586396 RepID=A0AAV0KV84_9ROSI|nr:unnamed protein product [Linum tenue]